MSSWKTTVLGVIGGLILILTQASNLLDNDPATLFELSQFIAGLGMLGVGWFARDNNKSSEDVGAK